MSAGSSFESVQLTLCEWYAENSRAGRDRIVDYVKRCLETIARLETEKHDARNWAAEVLAGKQAVEMAALRSELEGARRRDCGSDDDECRLEGGLCDACSSSKMWAKHVVQLGTDLQAALSRAEGAERALEDLRTRGQAEIDESQREMEQAIDFAKRTNTALAAAEQRELGLRAQLANTVGMLDEFDNNGVTCLTPKGREELEIARAALASPAPTGQGTERRTLQSRLVEDCEHESGLDDFVCIVCIDCGAAFIYCHPCSVAGGAERGVYHEAPACQAPAQSGAQEGDGSPRSEVRDYSDAEHLEALAEGEAEEEDILALFDSLRGVIPHNGIPAEVEIRQQRDQWDDPAPRNPDSEGDTDE